MTRVTMVTGGESDQVINKAMEMRIPTTSKWRMRVTVVTRRIIMMPPLRHPLSQNMIIPIHPTLGKIAVPILALHGIQEQDPSVVSRPCFRVQIVDLSPFIRGVSGLPGLDVGEAEEVVVECQSEPVIPGSSRDSARNLINEICS